MDGLHMVPSSAIDSFKVDLLMPQIFPPLDASYSLESAATENFPSQNSQRWVRHRTVANKITKTKDFSAKSPCQSLSTSCNSSAVILKGSNVTTSADRITNSPKEGSFSCRKKQRKRGKLNVRPSSCESGCILPVLSVDYNLGNDVHNEDSFISCADSLRVSLSDDGIGKKNGVSDCSEQPEALHLMQISSQMRDSVSTGSDGDCRNNATCDVKTCDTELDDSSLSVSPGLESKKGRPSNRKIQNGFGTSDIKVVVSQAKRSKQKREVRRCARASYSRNGKENSNGWQRFQWNYVSDYNSDLRKSSAVKESALLRKQHFVVARENAISQTKDVKMSKDKACWKLKKTINSVPKEELKSDCRRSSYTVNGGSIATTVNDNRGLESQSQIGSPAQSSQVGLGGRCIAVSGMNYREKEIYDDILLMKSCSTLEEWDLFEKRPHLNQFSYMEKQTFRTESSSHNTSSDYIARKWVPVGRPIGSSVNHSDLLAQDWTKTTIFEERKAPDSQNSQTCSSQPCKKQNSMMSSPSACRSEDNYNKHISLLLTNFHKISRAVNEAYSAQLESKAAQMVIGGPIAEFERLMHLSSPVIGHSGNSFSCNTCLADRVATVLCIHETPDVPLEHLWHWYEKHGSYGLEVRAESFEKPPKRLGIDRFAFRAYFVPFLSAVQLFRNNSSRSIKPKRGCNEVESPSLQSVETTVDLELLFEYFESEQPQQRRSLYEKIQELIRGDVPSRSKMCGDPTNLSSINLHDLHPCSWYSVAWYPIYRIPDGNFRAAFLTYHSLGHLVHRTTREPNNRTNGSWVVSPVVGLQSYNAEGECWLLPRQSASSRGLDTCGILTERLRTLEAAASLMARAVVNKGNQTCRNTHPDYEFFLSRRW